VSVEGVVSDVGFAAVEKTDMDRTGRPVEIVRDCGKDKEETTDGVVEKIVVCNG